MWVLIVGKTYCWLFILALSGGSDGNQIMAAFQTVLSTLSWSVSGDRPDTRAAAISQDDHAKYKKDVEGLRSNTTTHAQ